MSCPRSGDCARGLPYSPMIRRSPFSRGLWVKSGRAAGMLLAGAAALALQACASGARKPDLTLPAAYQAPVGTADVGGQTLDRWWVIFGDEELNGLEEQALRASPDVKSQIARLREAAATRNSNILQTFPTGDLTGGANHQNTTNLAPAPGNLIPIGGVSENDHLDFKVSWELDFFGALADARKAAKADYAASRFDIEAARASLVANVADSYFLARGLAIQLDDANQSVRIERDLLRIATLKASDGLGAASDADRIAGDLAQAQSQAVSLEAE